MLQSLGLRGLGTSEAEQVRVPAGNPPPARPGWENYVVSVKRVGDGWPVSDHHRIQVARGLREAGTHTTCQQTTREGWNFLYCVPILKEQAA
jgi:hypothetical protein